LRIARSLDTVFAGALERVETCDCGEETSCYGCLRNYRNQWIHDLLQRDRAIQVLRRIGSLRHAEPPDSISAPRQSYSLRLDGGTILTDTFTGQTTAMVLDDGRVLMHGEIYADAQQAADAVDHNVDALDFWAAELPGGTQPLRDILAKEQDLRQGQGKADRKLAPEDYADRSVPRQGCPRHPSSASKRVRCAPGYGPVPTTPDICGRNEPLSACNWRDCGRCRLPFQCAHCQVHNRAVSLCYLDLQGATRREAISMATAGRSYLVGSRITYRRQSRPR
jgi:hypothetical protein